MTRRANEGKKPKKVERKPDLKPDAPEHRCTATSKTGQRQCRQQAIPGGTVCRFHGGAAPQVIRAAKLRLAALVDPSIDAMAHLVKQNKHLPSKLGAAKDVLDRNQLGAKQISITTPDGTEIQGQGEGNVLIYLPDNGRGK